MSTQHYSKTRFRSLTATYNNPDIDYLVVVVSLVSLCLACCDIFRLNTLDHVWINKNIWKSCREAHVGPQYLMPTQPIDTPELFE